MIQCLVDLQLRSLAHWRSVAPLLTELRQQAFQDEIADSIRSGGLCDPFAGEIPAAEIRIDGTNYRESIVAQNTNARNRAVLWVLKGIAGTIAGPPRVYASEAISPFASRLASLFPRFVGSEYLESEDDRRQHPQVLHQDVQALTFAAASFDAYLSCEVLEHVPDLRRAVAEAARILRPGGHFVGTCPFAYNRERTIRRAVLKDGEVQHLLDPEYHGNPTRPNEGSLVFQVPSWDLLELCEDSGFSKAAFRLIASSRHGVISPYSGGVFVFDVEK